MKPICPGPPFCGGGPSCPQHGDATVQIQTDPPTPIADLINDPPHYRSICGVTIKSGQRILAGDLEAIDVSDAFDLDRYVANVVKYCLRAGRKGASIEDLRKARAYLDRKIARTERGE